MHVVNAVVSERLQHLIEQAFADVGTAHLRQRQADVVDRDGHAHVGIELREQRIGVLRMEQRVTDGLCRDPAADPAAAADRSRACRPAAFEQKFLAVRYDAALGAAIELDDQSLRAPTSWRSSAVFSSLSLLPGRAIRASLSHPFLDCVPVPAVDNRELRRVRGLFEMDHRPLPADAAIARNLRSGLTATGWPSAARNEVS